MLKRIIALSSAIALGVCFLPVEVKADNEDFDEFLQQEFVETMESDYLTLHYQLKDYEAYGIEKPELNFGVISEESYQDSIDSCQEALDTLHTFDYDALDETQQHDYLVYENYLENMIALNSYPQFDSLFSSSEGIQSNILTNFTEFVFYSEEDIEDYLVVLESTPEYIDNALELARQYADEGYFIRDSDLDETLDYIAKFVAKTEDNELIEVFNENMDALDFITDAQKEEYKEQNRDIVLNTFIPAYENMAEQLENLRGSRSQNGSIYDYGAEGQAYYAALVKYKTSSSMSIQEQFDLCEEVLSEMIMEYVMLYYYTDDDIDSKLENAELSVSEPMDILEYLENHLDAYPEGPDVSYTATYLDPSVANDSIVAYYVNPPVDDFTDNVIKINGDNISDSIWLYETLSHEGFPGHLYQITWYLNTNPALLRTTLTNIGYTEGWAMYAETHSLEDSNLDTTVAQINELNTAVSYILNAAADLAYNGLGYSVNEFGSWMDNLGLNSESASSLYDSVVDSMGVILPYGVGLAHFLSLRSTAESALGSDFDEKEFNTVLLTYGDRSFDLVEQDVNAWISEKKAQGYGSDGTDKAANSIPVNTVENYGVPTGYFVGAGAILVFVIVIVSIVLVRRKRKGPLA